MRRALTLATLVLAIGLGLAFRGWVLYEGANRRGDGDARYHPMAQSLLAGTGFSTDRGPCPRPDCIEVPAYPLFLAVVYLVTGSDNLGPVAAQLLLEIGTLLLLFHLVRNAASRRAARFMLLCAWLCPVLAFYSGHILAGALAAFVSVLYCSLTNRARATAERTGWVWVGLCGALLILIRVDAYPFVLLSTPVAIFWGRLRVSRAWADLAVWVGLLTLGLAPWMVRQWKTCGVLELPGAYQYARAGNPHFTWLDTWLGDPRHIEAYGYQAHNPQRSASIPADVLPIEEERSASEAALRALKERRTDDADAAFSELVRLSPTRRSFTMRAWLRVKRTALTWVLVPALLPKEAGRGVLVVLYGSWVFVLLAALVGVATLLRGLRTPSALLFALLGSRTAMPFLGGWAAVTVYLVQAFPAVYAFAGIGLATVLGRFLPAPPAPD